MHSTRSPVETAAEAAEQPAGGDIGMPVSLRPEWADLAGAAQGHLSDNARAVVAIDYAEDDAETLAYFRAVIEANETSARALQLTEEVIGVNPAHYSAWEWRWQCLAAANTELATEEPFLRRCTAENPKNYQLWNYRRRLALARGSACAPLEMEAAAATLAVDAKNYHAWAHRQALVAAWDLWDEELAFTEAVLADDVRNNSAWNQRFFILTRGGPQQPAQADGGLTDRTDPALFLPALVDNELSYVAAALHRAPDNASVWAYLRGLLTLPAGTDVFLYGDKVPDLCFRALQRLPSCTHAMDLLCEMYMARATAASQHGDVATASLAMQHAETLHAALEVADPLRQPYWTSTTKRLSLDKGKDEQDQV